MANNELEGESNEDFLESYDNYFNIVKENVGSNKCSDKSSKVREEGNKIYKRNEEQFYREILSLYSKSIALAPNNSEELAMAYGNRSALSFKLKKYKECLIDIERAYLITNSNKLKIKLLDRKTKCLAKITEKNNQQDESLKIQNEKIINKLDLKFVPSEKIPCAAESVSVDYNGKYGRHVIAAKDIKPGEIIVVEKPYVTIPVLNKMYLICSHCLGSAWTGLPCNCCSMVIYCSEKCKEEAWQHYHDVECPILASLYYMNNFFKINETVIMSILSAVRLFIKAVKKEGLENILNDVKYVNNNPDKHLNNFFDRGIFQNEKFKSIYNLSYSPNDKHTNDFDICSIITILLYKNDIFKNKVNSNDLSNTDRTTYILIRNCLMELKKIINLNTWEFDNEFDKKNDERDKIGIMTTPLCSLFNHSCNPNVRKIFTRNSEILIFAQYPIKKGTQIYDNYGPLVYEDKCSRQEFLQKNFYFTCDCIACSENWPVISTISMDDIPCTEVVYNFEVELAQYLKIRTNDPDDHKQWPCDEETMKRVLILIKLIYKHYNGYQAYAMAIEYLAYVEYNFFKLFVMKYNLPESC